MYRLRQPAEILQPTEIKPVAGHVSASYDSLVLIWGGYYVSFQKVLKKIYMF